MKECFRCKRLFNASSRHKSCPRCRKNLDKIPCPSCGVMKQRKSVLCRACFVKSKQYPFSKKKHLSKDGYLYVYHRDHPYSDKSGRVYEHRIIMEQELGRYLHPFENVHHKNGIRSDNRPDNLELWIKVQPTGGRVKDIVKWAKEILSLYGDVSSIG